MTETEDFKSWFERVSEKEGTLVVPATAAKLLKTTQPYIHRLEEQGKIKKHYYDNQPYIGMNDINKELLKRQEKQQRKKEKEENEIQNLKNKLSKSGLNKWDITPQLLGQVLINPALMLTPENQEKLSLKAKKQIEETGKLNWDELLSEIIHEIMLKKAHQLIDEKSENAISDNGLQKTKI